MHMFPFGMERTINYLDKKDALGLSKLAYNS